MKFTIDPRFAAHFPDLKQVFLYITDRCDIACEQCIYKPNVTFHGHREIPENVAMGLGEAFYSLGARKVTLLGGEPTLYGIDKGRQPLLRVLAGYRRIGYSFLRLDTNGQFTNLLEEPGFHELDELAFSLDGPTAELNDPVRGLGTFDRAVSNIRAAVAAGYNVTITCCIHRALLDRDGTGRRYIEVMIRFAQALGATVINFHDLLKAGVPMDTWTGRLNTSVDDHVEMYAELAPRLSDGSFSIPVRLPQCFATREAFESNPRYYGYCPVKLGERVLVHPNGVIRICSNLICSAFGVGRYYDDQIAWDRSGTNETLHHELEGMTPCTNRSQNRSYGPYVPLCFSFKPGQHEPVWRDMLQWDTRA